MRTAKILVVLMLALVLAGCGKEESESAERVKQEAGEALEATKDYLGERKDEVIVALQDRVTNLESDIDRLREQAAAKGDEAKAAFDGLKANLQARLETAKQKLDEARRASGDAWEAASSELQEAVENLKEAYRKAAKQVGVEGEAQSAD